MSDNPIYDAALHYAIAGHPVLPLRGKVPVGSLVPHGCLDATTDIAQIEAWWDHGDRPWNVGIATGHTVDVLDIDDEDRKKILFTVDSISARNVFGAIEDEVGDRMMKGEAAIVPLVMWGSEPFTAQGQQNYKPLPDILGWTTDAELVAFLDDDQGTLDDLFPGAGYVRLWAYSQSGTNFTVYHA